MPEIINTLTTYELRNFTAQFFKSVLPVDANDNANQSTMTPDDARLAIKILESSLNKPILKPGFIAALFGGGGWQGVVNDIRPAAYTTIRSIGSNAVAVPPMQTANMYSARLANVQMRLFSSN